MKQTNKRTKKGAIVALGMAGALAITGAFAFLSDSDSAINRFKFTDEDGEQTVDVEVKEPNWHPENGEDILPLETVAKDPMVYNEGENDVFSFVTVLVPTAKSIKLNNADGTVYEEKNVELFNYTVNDGWTEIDATKEVTLSAKSVTGKDDDSRKIVLNKIDKNDDSIKSLTNIDSIDGNIYYTAHTYAYAKDGAMSKVVPGESTEKAVFDSVTMINIADGEQIAKSLDAVYAETKPQFDAELAKADGAFAELLDNGYSVELVKDAAAGTISTVATKDGEDDIKKVIFETRDGIIYDTENYNAQLKVMSQFNKEDNINVYVTANAVQADNLGETDINAIWDICANTAAGLEEGQTLSNDFYFDIISKDAGHMSAWKGE